MGFQISYDISFNQCNGLFKKLKKEEKKMHKHMWVFQHLEENVTNQLFRIQLNTKRTSSDQNVLTNSDIEKARQEFM